MDSKIDGLLDRWIVRSIWIVYMDGLLDQWIVRLFLSMDHENDGLYRSMDCKIDGSLYRCIIRSMEHLDCSTFGR